MPDSFFPGPGMKLLATLVGRNVKRQQDEVNAFNKRQSWLGRADARLQFMVETATERGDGDPIPELLNMLNSEDYGVRASAAQAMGMMLEAEPDLEQRDEIIDRLIDTLHDGLNLKSLTAYNGYHMVEDGRIALSGATAEALARIADPRSIEGLIDGLQLVHRGARRYAALGLGRIGDPHAIPALTVALDDPDPDVRDTVIEALKAIGTEEALSAISEWREKRRQQAQL